MLPLAKNGWVRSVTVVKVVTKVAEAQRPLTGGQLVDGKVPEYRRGKPPEHIPPKEREFLAELFAGTKGNRWKHKEGWAAGHADPWSDPGTWHGVTVALVTKAEGGDGNAHVVKLRLFNNNVSGPIPASIAKVGGGDARRRRCCCSGASALASTCCPPPTVSPPCAHQQQCEHELHNGGCRPVLHGRMN